MRKFLSLLLTLLMTACLTTAALAEAAPTATPGPEVADPESTETGDDALSDEESSLSDEESFGEDALESELQYTAAARAADGTVTLDNLYTFHCPQALESIEIDPADVADGLIFSAYSDTMGVDIYKYPSGEDTLDSLYEVYKQDSQMNEVALGDVAGVRVLVYRIDDTGINATLEDGAGAMYDIMITYQTAEEYSLVGQMIASIKKTGA